MTHEIGLCHECYRWRAGRLGGEQDQDTGVLTKASENEERKYDDVQGQAAEGPQKRAEDDQVMFTINKQLADDMTKRMIPPYGWVSMVVEDGNDYSPKSEQL